MNKKWIPYLLIVLMALTVFFIKQCRNIPVSDPKHKITDPVKPRDPASDPMNRENGFDRRVSFLEYSKHADCRMKCRHISTSEVEEIMNNGKINYNKSDLKNARCPRYAVEGITHDDQRVRIVFAQCNDKTVVVTVIDLETAFNCDCPGDDDKYKNRN